MGVAQLHSGVAGHVAAQLFLVNSAIDVAGQGVVTQVALAHVQSDEGDVGILVCHLGDGLAKGVAGHHDDGVALVHSGLHHGDTLSGGVTGGLVVAEVNAVGVAVGLAGLISSLVERLVGDIAVVGDHGHAEISAGFLGGLLGLGGLFLSGLCLFLGTAAGDQGQGHDQCQNHSKKLLHWNLPSFKFFDLCRNRGTTPKGRGHYINSLHRFQQHFHIVFCLETILVKTENLFIRVSSLPVPVPSVSFS